MRAVEDRVVATMGADGEVRAQIHMSANGMYRVRLAEREGGLPERYPKVAEGISDPKVAWGMLDVFVEGYMDAMASSVTPVPQLLKAGSDG